MKFSSPLIAVLVAVAPVSAALSKRDFGQLANDGLTIYNDLQNVMAKLNAFGPGGSQGTLGQALDVNNATSQLNTDLQTAAKDAAATDPLDDGESGAIASAIAQLQTSIFSTLDLLVTKQPQFNAVQGFLPAGGLVKNQLVALKNSTDAYGAALTPKLTPTYGRLAPLLVSNFDYHFIRAIQAYNGSLF